jgi:hypothetical protein
MMAAAHPLHKLSREQYVAEREQIAATYGDNAAEAGALRDQALAALYWRSGWTQEELAEVEGCAQQTITRRLLFGRFLVFTPSGSNPRNLTDRRFRSYWERTSGTNERQRFAEVARLIEEDLRVGKPPTPHKALGAAIMAEFADGKWHNDATIKANFEAPPEHVDAVLDGMRTKGNYGAQCERRAYGKSHQYRIVKGGGKRIDAAVLTQELRPLLDGLYAEGKKNAAHISGAAVQILAGRIEKLIEQLAK